MDTSLHQLVQSEDNDKKTTESAGDDSESWIGPLPEEAEQPKKRRKLVHEQVYRDRLPLSEGYERSYMHRDVVTHVVCTPTQFLITASSDGHLKFWKKTNDSIEFVKHFRAHLGNIQHVSSNDTGNLLATISNDKAVKVFDVINFDMINMIRLDFVPRVCVWIHSGNKAPCMLAISDRDSSKIFIYDGHDKNEPAKVLDKLHSNPVVCLSYNPVYEVIVSVDKKGMVEYWSSHTNDYKFPQKTVNFQFKTDTDLYELMRNQTYASSIAFSPNGKQFAALCRDRKVRIFKFLTGKLASVIDESLKQYSESQNVTQLLPNMEFSRRIAMEKELEKSESIDFSNIVYDESGYFLLYPCPFGVKVVNLYTRACVKMIGKGENARFLNISLFQGKSSKTGASTTLTVEMEAADNPSLQRDMSDPSLFCTAFKKNRFYVFSKREPDDSGVDGDRDVFNEKPSKEDIIAATESEGSKRISDACIIYTSMGDIHCKLFPKECPKSIENFCVHARNGYYNGHIFHRVIKAFMVQTGDPTGTGTGGASIWGGEFEDEFHHSLKHDRPYTMSMANAGPDTNGSQFFITVVPCPWLDNKHTVFGRVIRGMEVVQNISNIRVHPKTDKPHDDIRIVSISLK